MIKATLLLCAAGCVIPRLARRSAAERHLLWTASLGAATPAAVPESLLPWVAAGVVRERCGPPPVFVDPRRRCPVGQAGHRRPRHRRRIHRLDARDGSRR